MTLENFNVTSKPEANLLLMLLFYLLCFGSQGMSCYLKKVIIILKCIRSIAAHRINIKVFSSPKIVSYLQIKKQYLEQFSDGFFVKYC